MTETISLEETREPEKFGTFVGVYVPSILMLFGVIIFLRLGWITGQAGLFTTLCVVSLGTLIALLTILSMASIATNIELGKGGIYYILSRSLGVDVGAALGIPLFLNQSLCVAFCAVGFAESLHDLMPSWPITTIGVVTLLCSAACSCASLKGALKTQVVIFVIMIFSLMSLFTGGDLRDSSITYEPSQIPLGFWGVFALFFPAMTGMESSISLSGDLRNPSRSLPIGAISALLTGYAIYMLIPVFLAQHVPLERLRSDTMVIQDLSSVPALIIAGIWAATLSGVLGGLLGAPRTLQAIAEDGVAPSLFKKTYGKNSEPVFATIFTFLIALTCIIFGSINQIAPVMTMICLSCYGVLNLAAGLETFLGNPSWRPRVRVHWALSFLGSLLCLIAMLMIGSGSALMVFGLMLSLYFLNKKRQIQTSWEDITQGILHFISRYAIYRLAYTEGCSKTWRPHFLVFAKKLEEQTDSFVKIIQSIQPK